MRTYTKKMIPVFIVPTGLGAKIGGHAGDATPALKLIASVSDIVITHPNVVNASDINEMPDNSLYVEGSVLDRFLWGQIILSPVYQNKILLVVNKPADENIINAVSAARTTIGADIQVLELDTPLEMIASMEEDGRAGGEVKGDIQLYRQVSEYEFDALAICTPIAVSDEIAMNYLKNGGINPWGGIEAIASRLISNSIDKPVAHAPFGSGVMETFKEVVDPRMSAEMVSICYLHCVLKGLHKAPRINMRHAGSGLSVEDVSCLITPAGCVGEPHWACAKHNIPIIVVKENQTCLNDEPIVHTDAWHSTNFIEVENYIEAAGLLSCWKAGVTVESIRRPISHTKVFRNRPKQTNVEINEEENGSKN